MAVDSKNVIKRTEAQAVPESFIVAVVADVILGNGPKRELKERKIS